MFKKTFNLFAVLAMFALILFTGCADDGTDLPGSSAATTLFFVQEAGVIFDDDSVDTGAPINLKVSATAGGEDLASVSFRVNNTLAAAGSFDVDGVASTGNPAPLSGADQQSFVKTFTVNAPTTANETNEYRIVVTDAAQRTAFISVFVTTRPNEPAEVSFVTGQDQISRDDTVSANALMTFQINAEQGEAPMSSFSVMRNDTLISLSELTFSGLIADNNPVALTGADQDSLNVTVSVNASKRSDVIDVYKFTITDELQNSSSVSATIFTSPTVLQAKLLLNQSGPQGQGGINLFTGESTGTVESDPTSDLAHIRDQGIDLDKVAAENWIQQIAPMNGSLIKVPAVGLEFDALNTSADIEAAFNDTGSSDLEFADGEKVAVDDVYLIENSGSYFIIRITDINVTTGDNLDFYEMTIKY